MNGVVSVNGHVKRSLALRNVSLATNTSTKTATTAITATANGDTANAA